MIAGKDVKVYNKASKIELNQMKVKIGDIFKKRPTKEVYLQGNMDFVDISHKYFVVKYFLESV